MQGITKHCIYLIYVLSCGPHGFRIVFPFIVNGRKWHLGCGQFGPQGHGWQDLFRGPQDIALYQIYKMWA